MSIRRSFPLIVLLLLLCFGAAAPAAEEKILFQTSTLQALMNGVYDGDFTLAELARRGDFGLGTFEALDGELVGLDGKFYQVKNDGKAYPVNPAQKTPFAQATFFRADRTLNLAQPLNLKQLEEFLAGRLPSANFPYALKLSGNFSFVKTRSVPRQSKPYPPLTEVAQKQTVFEFREVEGVIVGFYHPAYLAGLNVAGYHFHFLTADRRAGGHLLDCRLKQVKVEWSRLTDLQLRLPPTAEFSRTDLTGDKQKEIEKGER